MDFILNGQASGDVATRLLACNFDVRSLRPYIGRDERSYVNVDRGGVINAVPMQNATATLRKDDWKILDDAMAKYKKIAKHGGEKLEDK